MYNCIIFDVDGTLIDTESVVTASYQKVIYEEFGRNFEPEEMAIAYGVPTNEVFERLGFRNVREACKRYHGYLMDSFCHVKVFHDMIEVLECLKKNNIMTGIVTSRARREIDEDACLQGLMKYFATIVCADDTKMHKPNAEPILKFIEKSKTDISKTLYIGDTFFDYMCARNAGVDFALAVWGAKNKDNINADYDLMEPKELLRIL